MHAQFECRSIGGASLTKLEDIDHASNREMGGAEGIRVPRPSPRSGNIPRASKTFDRQTIAYFVPSAAS